MKRLMAIGCMGGALMALAMPTREALVKAQDMVSDVTAADMKALKAGTKKPAEVAAAHLELADKATAEAEKYLLLQGAFQLYAKAGDYENAANVIETMQAGIKDFDPEVVVELCGKAFIRKMKESAPRLYALKENARRIVFYKKQLPEREKAAKDKPKDHVAQKELGECYAELGDWPAALKAFAKAGGDLAIIAVLEAKGKAKPQRIADFWWDYETKSNTPVYRLHAVEYYQTALAVDAFQGLARERAERRVKAMESDQEAAVTKNVASKEVQPKRRANSIVKSLGDEFSLELAAGLSIGFAKCASGTFQMSGVPNQDGGKKHAVKLTRAFWIQETCVNTAMFKAFDAQYQPPDPKKELVQGRNRAEVFVKWLNEKFGSKLPAGYVFRLPTEAEWEYASSLGTIPKSYEFEGTFDTVPAIFDKPNAWKANTSVLKYAANETDPVRVCEKNAVWVCRQADVKRFLLRFDGPGCFRIVVGPELRTEKK